jgi:hypothetical protein
VPVRLNYFFLDTIFTLKRGTLGVLLLVLVLCWVALPPGDALQPLLLPWFVINKQAVFIARELARQNVYILRW